MLADKLGSACLARSNVSVSAAQRTDRHQQNEVDWMDLETAAARCSLPRRPLPINNVTLEMRSSQKLHSKYRGIRIPRYSLTLSF